MVRFFVSPRSTPNQQFGRSLQTADDVSSAISNDYRVTRPVVSQEAHVPITSWYGTP